MIGTNFQLYKQITDDPEFAKHLYDFLFQRYRTRAEKESPETAQSATGG